MVVQERHVYMLRIPVVTMDDFGDNFDVEYGGGGGGGDDSDSDVSVASQSSDVEYGGGGGGGDDSDSDVSVASQSSAEHRCGDAPEDWACVGWCGFTAFLTMCIFLDVNDTTANGVTFTTITTADCQRNDSVLDISSRYARDCACAHVVFDTHRLRRFEKEKLPDHCPMISAVVSMDSPIFQQRVALEMCSLGVAHSTVDGIVCYKRHWSHNNTLTIDALTKGRLPTQHLTALNTTVFIVDDPLPATDLSCNYNALTQLVVIELILLAMAVAVCAAPVDGYQAPGRWWRRARACCPSPDRVHTD